MPGGRRGRLLFTIFSSVESSAVTPFYLHGNKVSFTVDFKVILLIYKALNGLRPAYILILCNFILSQLLRSSAIYFSKYKLSYK